MGPIVQWQQFWNPRSQRERRSEAEAQGMGVEKRGTKTSTLPLIVCCRRAWIAPVKYGAAMQQGEGEDV